MLDYTQDKDLASIKLLAVDMDLTLLADDGTQPPNMAEKIRALDEAGIVFCAASGRPWPTLARMFEDNMDRIALCADNGAFAMYRHQTVFRDLIDPIIWHRGLAQASTDERCVPTMCCFDHAVVLERDRCHEKELSKYYKDIRYVQSFDDVDEPSNKFSLLFPGYDAEEAFAEYYRPTYSDELYVTNAGREWIDFMNLGTSKGSGVGHLCQKLGITMAQVAAVGDTYNDIPLLEAAGHSFIVANAEKHMEAHATYRVPSNNDRGVAALIDALLAAQTHRRAQNHQ